MFVLLLLLFFVCFFPFENILTNRFPPGVSLLMGLKEGRIKGKDFFVALLLSTGKYGGCTTSFVNTVLGLSLSIYKTPPPPPPPPPRPPRPPPQHTRRTLTYSLQPQFCCFKIQSPSPQHRGHACMSTGLRWYQTGLASLRNLAVKASGRC